MVLFGLTDKGVVRKQNQDEFRIAHFPEKSIAILTVCDGMGGAKAGNIASHMAADLYMQEVTERLDEMTDAESVREILTDAVVLANSRVFEKSVEDEQCSGMGTTLVSAVIGPFGCAVVNVGDSRAYHIGSVGIRQVTNDHSVVAELVSSGKISRSEAHNHPNKNLITRAIGTAQTVEADVFTVELDKGEFLLLCSDGLSNIIGDQELLFEVLRQQDIAKSCQALIDLALSRGAPDNVTAVVYRN